MILDTSFAFLNTEYSIKIVCNILNKNIAANGKEREHTMPVKKKKKTVKKAVKRTVKKAVKKVVKRKAVRKVAKKKATRRASAR